jgi:thioredoxin reductase (NADPH)
MKKQAERFGARIINEEVVGVDFAKKPFAISQKSVKAGQSWSRVSQELVQTNSTNFRLIQPILTRSIIIATGAKARWLGLESEQRLIGKGVSSCATCDGFFFRDKTVAVVGGGDMALQEALFLTKFASKVYLIHRRDSFRAAKILQDKILKDPKIEVIWNTVIEEVLGKEKVEGVRLKVVNDQLSTNSTIKLDGLFVAIGHEPETKIFGNQLEIDAGNSIITSERYALELAKLKAQSSKLKANTQNSNIKEIKDKFDFNYKHITSVDGVFAAGDCCDPRYRQVATAVGAGVAAALELEKWLAK